MNDKFQDDDYGRKPGQRVDSDIALPQARAEFESTPLEELHAAEAMAAKYWSDPVAREVLLDNQDTLRVEAPREQASEASSEQSSGTANESPAAVTPESLQQSQDAAQQAHHLDAGAGASNASAGQPGSVEKPLDVESSLARIRQTEAREDRIVILGDPDLKRRLYDTLAMRGMLTYERGVPVVSASNATVFKVLQEVAGQVEGASAHHALNLSMDREGHGLLGRMKAAASNTFGFRDNVDVMVIGSKETVDTQLKQLGSLVNKLHADNLVDYSSADAKAKAYGGDKPSAQSLVSAEGKLLVPEQGPAKLAGTLSLYNLIQTAKDSVSAYDRQETAKSDARHALRNENDDKKLADRAAAAEAAAQVAGEGRPVKVSEHAEKLAGELNLKMVRADALHELNGSKQPYAIALSRQLSALRDPMTPEVATLPKVERQQLLVQALALHTKLDAGEFGEAGKAELTRKSSGSTMTASEKLSEWVAAEVARDPSFPAAAKEQLASLVHRGLITEEQASKALSGPLAQAAATPTTTVAPSASATDAAAAPAAQPGQQNTSNAEAAPRVVESAVSASLSDRLQQATSAGAPALTKEQAGSLLAELESRRMEPLSALLPGDAAQQREGLDRLKTVLDAAEKLGGGLSAQAKDLRSEVAGWDAQLTGKTAESVTAPAPAVDAKASPVSAAPVAQTQADLATAESFAKLASMMSHPPRAFTTDNKEWNDSSIRKAADLMSRLDVDSVGRMNPKDQVAVALYTAWFVDSASSGKMPGFTSDSGKAQLAGLTEKAIALQAQLPSKLPESTTAMKEYERATAMVTEMHDRSNAMSANQGAAEASAQRPTVNIDSHAYAKDVVHAVYHETELSESYVKHLLKNADALTPARLTGLDQETKAQAVAALGFLAMEVKDGAMGDFASLPKAVRDITDNASRVAGKLATELSNEPGMRTQLTKAYSALDGIESAAPEKTNSPSRGNDESRAPSDKASSEMER